MGKNKSISANFFSIIHLAIGCKWKKLRVHEMKGNDIPSSQKTVSLNQREFL